MYFEAWLSDKLLLTEQKCLAVQFLDYSAKLAGSPARLRHSSDLREQHRGKQRGPPKTLLLGLKNYSCLRVSRGTLQHRPLGGGQKISHGHLGRAHASSWSVGQVPAEPARPSTVPHGGWVVRWYSPAVIGNASKHPHTLRESKGVSSPASLSLRAASGGSATPAVTQAVYSGLRFHDVNSLDLSKLCDI